MSEETLNWGLSSKNVELITDLLRPLAATSQIFIFGSRARGDFKKFSDIDLLISGNPDPKLLSQVKEALEESALPYKIDLVLECNLAPEYALSVTTDKQRFL